MSSLSKNYCNNGYYCGGAMLLLISSLMATIPKSSQSFILPSGKNSNLSRNYSSDNASFKPLQRSSTHHHSPLFATSSSSSDDNDDSENDSSSSSPQQPPANNELSSLRAALESSWNGDLMGTLPSTPQKGAAAAAASISAALSQPDKVSGIVGVDILLPSYDITQGFEKYDEILAVEFATALAEALCEEEGGVAGVEKCAVLVKDAGRERNVRRVLEVKEERRKRAVASEEEEEEDEGTVAESEGSAAGSDTDMEAYRRQLLSSWSDDDDNDTGATTTSPSPSTSSSPQTGIFSPRVRLGSLLGDAYIQPGPDTFNDVIEAVDEYAVKADDDALIILSAVTAEEMIAVRRLAARYDNYLEGEKESKPIILVNCKFQTMPIELRYMVTGYAILPLLARPKAPTGGFSSAAAAADAPTKIVLLRRFPEDWQLFVDASGRGNGFELAGSMSSEDVRGRTMPGMDWIAECVKRHMDFKYRQ